jgi:hypothetical protein
VLRENGLSWHDIGCKDPTRAAKAARLFDAAVHLQMELIDEAAGRVAWREA